MLTDVVAFKSLIPNPGESLRPLRMTSRAPALTDATLLKIEGGKAVSGTARDPRNLRLRADGVNDGWRDRATTFTDAIAGVVLLGSSCRFAFDPTRRPVHLPLPAQNVTKSARGRFCNLLSPLRASGRRSRTATTMRAAALVLGLFFTPSVSSAVHTITNAVNVARPADNRQTRLHFPRPGSARALTKSHRMRSISTTMQ